MLLTCPGYLALSAMWSAISSKDGLGHRVTPADSKVAPNFAYANEAPRSLIRRVENKSLSQFAKDFKNVKPVPEESNLRQCAVSSRQRSRARWKETRSDPLLVSSLPMNSFISTKNQEKGSLWPPVCRIIKRQNC